MPLTLEDLEFNEQATSWFQDLLILDGQALTLLLVVLVVLYFFRNFVIGFLGFSLKLLALAGIFIFVLQFFPAVEELKSYPLLASLFSY
jgi:hypothetical protein